MTEERVSWEKYRPIALAASALQQGDSQKAIGALEIMLQNFGTSNAESRLIAHQLANDPQTTIQNYLSGYQQLHKKKVGEIANEIHGDFLKEKLGDQYELFQADLKNYSEMTYESLMKQHQRLINLQKMVKDGSAKKNDENEIKKLERSLNVYNAISTAEEVELKKIDVQIEENGVNNIYESIRNAYQAQAEKAAQENRKK